MHIPSQDFDLEKIRKSGQCFRMVQTGDNTFALIAHGRRLHLAQKPDFVELACTQEDFDRIWKDYFDLSTDYAAFRGAVDAEDDFLTQAAAFGEGIRILQQDAWEMLVTFLISQRKNIPAIQKAVEALCRLCGEPFEDEGETYYAFPTPQSIAKLSREDLDGCSLGYRSPYVLAAARLVADGTLNLTALQALNDDALLEALQTVPGVGPKVANCVALFGFHRLAGFPRDVWINRVIDDRYGGVFPLERYEGFAGVIQQYLFFYARDHAYSAQAAAAAAT
jgi:N-glycosylase/DNA lyase